MISKLDKSIQIKIYDTINDISENPLQSTKRLSGSRFYRLRVGKYRVIFDLHKNKMIIFVINVDNRKRIYKR
jgi:mRNA interferase RelE/StbE